MPGPCAYFLLLVFVVLQKLGFTQISPSYSAQHSFHTSGGSLSSSSSPPSGKTYISGASSLPRFTCASYREIGRLRSHLLTLFSRRFQAAHWGHCVRDDIHGSALPRHQSKVDHPHRRDHDARRDAAPPFREQQRALLAARFPRLRCWICRRHAHLYTHQVRLLFSP